MGSLTTAARLDEPLVVPVRTAARGLLGDCDLRWLAVVGLLCALVLRLVATHG